MHRTLDPLLAQLAERRQRLLGELATLSHATLNRRPDADSWSLLQVAEHLELVESAMLGTMRQTRATGRTLRRRPKNYLGYAIFRVVMATGIRVRVPGRVQTIVTPPDSTGDLDAIAARWAQTADALEAHVRGCGPDELRRFVALHPITGPLTPRQVLLFLRRHLDHHRRQIRRIRARLASAEERTSGAAEAPTRG